MSFIKYLLKKKQVLVTSRIKANDKKSGYGPMPVTLIGIKLRNVSDILLSTNASIYAERALAPLDTPLDIRLLIDIKFISLNNNINKKETSKG